MRSEKEIKDFMINSKYLCVGTSDKSGKVWTAPLTYVADEVLNIYFHSALDSIHIQNIRENPEVAFSIYDSEQLLANIDGIQGKAIVGQLENDEVEKIHNKFFEKHMPNEEIRKQFAPPYQAFLSEEAPQKRFFKMYITEMYKKNLDIFEVARRQRINKNNL